MYAYYYLWCYGRIMIVARSIRPALQKIKKQTRDERAQMMKYIMYYAKVSKEMKNTF